MYCTCYAAKSTKEEDKESIIAALDSLLQRRMTAKQRRLDTVNEGANDQDQPQVSEEDSPTIGFRQMLASLMKGKHGYIQ